MPLRPTRTAGILILIAAPVFSQPLTLPPLSLISTGTASAGGFIPETPIPIFTPGQPTGPAVNPTYNLARDCGAGPETLPNNWLTAATSSAGVLNVTALSNPFPYGRSISYGVTVGGFNYTGTVTEAADTEPLPQMEVRALYQSILGRDPDAAGFSFWGGTGASGLGTMADDFLISPEAFDTDFAVMSAYQAATGAPPTYAQFIAAAAGLRSGAPPLAGLFNSLTPAGYSASNLYQNLLGRSPSTTETASANAAGLPSWFETLIGYPASATPIGIPNNEFQNTGIYSTEPDHSNALYVNMLYFNLLSRNPDAGGLTFWGGVANSGGPGILFQGANGYPTRVQILGSGVPGQGFLGATEFQGYFICQ